MPLFIPTLIFAISLSLLPSAGSGHVDEDIAHKQRKISSQSRETTAEASEAVMGLQDARTLNYQNDQSRRIPASASDAENGGVVKTDDCWIRTSFRDDQRLRTGHECPPVRRRRCTSMPSSPFPPSLSPSLTTS